MGCLDKKNSMTDSMSIGDSLTADTAATDTMETIIAETPMPKAADELFDDFFFNFAANGKLQKKRIKFPLPVIRRDTTFIKATAWKTEHFFMHQDYYTLIFDNARQMNVVKDTTIHHVIVEKIYLKRHFVKQYLFDRMYGKWMMTAIRYEGMRKNRNWSFLNFYNKFATDSAFQISSINDPLDFSGPSSDDEFATTSGFLAPEQWLSFAPELPAGMIYNIQYDNNKRAGGSQKIFVIRGISNGLETELTFRRKGGKWKLIKLIV